MKEEEREYIIPFDEARNYICTNPDDYQAAKEWVIMKDKRR